MKKNNTIEIACDHCKKKFLREKKEFNRSKKKNMKMFCSMRCSGLSLNNSKTILERIPREKQLEGSRKANSQRGDDLSPFRYYHNIIRNRSKRKCCVTLEDLKKQWEEQKGVCPYTGVLLVLPKNTTGFKDKDNKLYKASLDRINSSKEYEKDNIQFVSWMANTAKNDVNDKMMMLFCKSIANRWSQGSPQP